MKLWQSLDKLKVASEYIKSIIIIKFNKNSPELNLVSFLFLSTHS